MTWRSSIGSSSAACVRGDARFTSSTSTTLAKIGPGPEVPHAGRRAVHRGAGDVGGQEVGRALHPAVAAADRGGQRLREQRLAGAGHPLDEQVPARQQRDQREPDRVGRAAHRARDRVEELGRHRAGSRDRGRIRRLRELHAASRLEDARSPPNRADGRPLDQPATTARSAPSSSVIQA